jgi:energy-coupling factor transporter ATP-binding protein EcfA2
MKLKALLRKYTKKYVDRITNHLFGPAVFRRREARRLAKTVLHEYRRLGFSKAIVAKKGKRKWQHVQFEEPVLMTVDDLWMPIDLQRLPVGVKTNDLRDENVLKSLEDRLNRAVRYDQLANGKICLVVRVSGSKFPARVGIAQFSIPQDAHELTFVLGVDREGEKRFTDIETLKHLLVVGATGGGKTTLIHSMLYAFITRNSHDDIEIWLADMKAGAELGRYSQLAGTKKEPGIVRHIAKDSEAAILMLDNALSEIMRRNKLMAQHNASNLADLRNLTGERLRRIVVIVDEFAMLMLDKNKFNTTTVGRMAENIITKIASLGRSAGVHLVIATQMINKEVISGMILANFENRIAFSVADWRKSQLVIETSEAVNLPPGRCIFKFGGKTEEFQAPYITPEQTRLEISRVARHGPVGLGEDEEQGRFLREAKLLLSMAVKELDGKVTRNKLLQMEGIRGVISWERFAEITARLERDRVIEKYGGRGQGRRIVPVFHNNLALLDSMYGTPNASHQIHTKTKEIEFGVDALENGLALSNAVKSDADKPNDLVYGVENPITPGDSDDEVPDAFLRAFQADEKGAVDEQPDETE